MTFIDDVANAKRRFGAYIDRFLSLFKEYGVQRDGFFGRLRAANRNAAFRAKRDAIWRDILEHEGGKISLGTALAIIGAVLGGIGVAGFGGAVGIPLALLLAPVGVIFGHEIDEHGVTQKTVSKVRDWFGSVFSTEKVAQNSPSGSSTRSGPDNVFGENHWHEAPTNAATTEDQDEDLAAVLQLMIELEGRYDSLAAEMEALRKDGRFLDRAYLDQRLVDLQKSVNHVQGWAEGFRARHQEAHDAAQARLDRVEGLVAASEQAVSNAVEAATTQVASLRGRMSIFENERTEFQTRINSQEAAMTTIESRMQTSERQHAGTIGELHRLDEAGQGMYKFVNEISAELKMVKSRMKWMEWGVGVSTLVLGVLLVAAALALFVKH